MLGLKLNHVSKRGPRDFDLFINFSGEYRGNQVNPFHYHDVIMGAIASQITSLMIVFSTVYLDTDQRKHRSSASLAFVRGIHRRPVNSPHKWPVTRKMFPFDGVIICCYDIFSNTNISIYVCLCCMPDVPQIWKYHEFVTDMPGLLSA